VPRDAAHAPQYIVRWQGRGLAVSGTGAYLAEEAVEVAAAVQRGARPKGFPVHSTDAYNTISFEIDLSFFFLIIIVPRIHILLVKRF
jgi:hypothetical protein